MCHTIVESQIHQVRYIRSDTSGRVKFFDTDMTGLRLANYRDTEEQWNSPPEGGFGCLLYIQTVLYRNDDIVHHIQHLDTIMSYILGVPRKGFGDVHDCPRGVAQSSKL